MKVRQLTQTIIHHCLRYNVVKVQLEKLTLLVVLKKIEIN